jgi:hypothetical protein
MNNKKESKQNFPRKSAPDFLQLSSELIFHIFSFLGPAELLSIGQTCTTLRYIADRNEFWHPIFTKYKKKPCLIMGARVGNSKPSPDVSTDADRDYDVAVGTSNDMIIDNDNEDDNDNDNDNDNFGFDNPVTSVNTDDVGDNNDSDDNDEMTSDEISSDFFGFEVKPKNSCNRQANEVDIKTIVDASSNYYDWKKIFLCSVEYETFEEAVAAANDGEVIILPKGRYAIEHHWSITKSIDIIGDDFPDTTTKYFAFIESKTQTNHSKESQTKNIMTSDRQQQEEKSNKRRDDSTNVGSESSREETEKQKQKEAQERDQRKVIIFSNKFTVLRWEAPRGRLQNLTIRQELEEGSPYRLFGLVIESGAPVIDHCEFSSTSLSAISVKSPDGAAFSRCYISRSAQNGLIVWNSFCSIQRCIFENCEFSAVAIVKATNKMVLAENIIRFCYSGIRIRELLQSDIVIESNRIFATQTSAIRFERCDSSSIILRGNIIAKTSALGITVDLTNGSITVANNEIVGNSKSGLLIRDSDLQVIVSNNLIADNGDNGMDLKRLPNVRIQNNIIRGNILSGIDICACNATVTENTIINNETGLYLFSESVAAVLNNKINDNKTNGLEMRPGVQLTALEGNEVMNNGEIGALLCCLESISMPNITFSEVNMKNKVVNNHKENIVIEVIDNTKSLPEKPLWAREYTQPTTYDVEEAIRKGLCTFTRTGHHFHQQYWWRCITCELSVHEGVCLVCKEKCHKGHQFVTQQPNFSGFYW